MAGGSAGKFRRRAAGEILTSIGSKQPLFDFLTLGVAVLSVALRIFRPRLRKTGRAGDLDRDVSGI